eukprot:5727343-Prymnesium_polylepis.1
MLYKRALAIYEKHRGKKHENTVTTCANLATAMDDGGDTAAASKYARRALEGYTTLFGPDHKTTLRAKNNLAVFLTRQGVTLEAVELAMDIKGQDESTLESAYFVDDDDNEVDVDAKDAEKLNFGYDARSARQTF